MKPTIRHYGPVVGLLAGLTAVALLLVVVAAPVRDNDSGKQVVATTYPLYLAAKNIAAGTDVKVATLSGAPAGCLHDYQLSPADRLALEQADAVLTNGLGAEPFLEGLDLPVVDTTAGMTDLLCAAEHHGHEHDHEQEDYNEHVWASPRWYYQQAVQVSRALATVDVEGQQRLQERTVAYLDAIQAVVRQLDALAADLNGTPCVVFHPSLAYFAADAGLDVRLTLSAGEESGLPAADLAAVEQLVKEDPDTLLLYDSQYTVRYPAVDTLAAPGRVLTLDSGTVGTGRDTDWLDAMYHNINALQSLEEVAP